MHLVDYSVLKWTDCKGDLLNPNLVVFRLVLHSMVLEMSFWGISLLDTTRELLEGTCAFDLAS